MSNKLVECLVLILLVAPGGVGAHQALAITGARLCMGVPWEGLVQLTKARW